MTTIARPEPGDPPVPPPDPSAETRAPGSASPGPTLRFGLFELRLDTAELLKDGVAVRLRPQSLQVLALLAERSGQLVTREDIQAQVWRDGTVVDFEQGLNHCIKEIRAALGDHAEAPVYVETLARRGYRFIVPVERLEPRPAALRPRRIWAWGVAALTAVLAAGLLLVVRGRSPAVAAGRRVMIAVLPFENLSGDPEQDYFADGLTEEIVGQLGRLEPGRLGVVGRIPAMEYRRRPRGFDALQRELGVSYVLTGTVRRSADRVRITTGLTQVSDRRQVWSEVYDRELKDILTVQRTVADAVGARLLLALTRSPARGAALQVDPEAYTLFLKGRYFWNRRDGAAIRKSIEFFEQSIARQPDYAMAYVGLAEAYIVLGQRTAVNPAEIAPKARAAAVKALELDADLPEARVALAGVMGLLEWNWTGAERELRRALDIDPSDPTGHHWYSHVLRAQGRMDEALAEIRTASTLAPLSLIIATDLGNMLLYAGDLEGAGRQYQSVLELDPAFAPAHRGMGRVRMAQGATAQAVASFEKAVSLSDNPRYSAWLAYAYVKSGRPGDARALLGKMSPPLPGCAYDVATIHAALGNREAAMEWLRRAYRDREPSLRYLMLDERLRGLRAEPDLVSLSRRIGVSASAEPTGA
jgi:TolB-like protein/DNA-binding winged helix-turn-helix (wHTH) protein/tetratricopeptide (TPR) repeat protein